ncbi:MAG: Rieske 2Fe-2S domain-containing protein, partial [Solirubrobacteraceae bacterium]
SVTLELAIKRALEEAAPDLVGLEVEGVAPQMTGLALPMAEGASSSTATELPMVMSGPEPAPPAWVALDTVAALQDGALAEVSVAGGTLVVANVDGTLLAYRDTCAACGGSLHDGELSDGALSCPSCQRSYFLPRAGRSLDGDALQLEPVPLLREQGHVKVAVGAA